MFAIMSPERLMRIWCSGTTASCWIGFLAKYLFDLSKWTSHLELEDTWPSPSGPCRMLYINKWPWCVPTSSRSSELKNKEPIIRWCVDKRSLYIEIRRWIWLTETPRQNVGIVFTSINAQWHKLEFTSVKTKETIKRQVEGVVYIQAVG